LDFHFVTEAVNKYAGLLMLDKSEICL